MVGMTVPVSRLDAIAEPRRKRRNDPLDGPELLHPELRLVLHVLTGDRASPNGFGESGRPGKSRELADGGEDRLRAFGKRLITDLEVSTRWQA